jgi:dCMP deaminase
MRSRAPLKKHSNYMSLAEKASSKSNCARRNVGAVLVRNGRILTAASNGVARRFRNCLVAGAPDASAAGTWEPAMIPAYVIHAEQMVLAKAAQKGQSVRGAILYVNLRPCLSCLNLAIAAGVKKIVYKPRHCLILHSVAAGTWQKNVIVPDERRNRPCGTGINLRRIMPT